MESPQISSGSLKIKRLRWNISVTAGTRKFCTGSSEGTHLVVGFFMFLQRDGWRSVRSSGWVGLDSFPASARECARVCRKTSCEKFDGTSFWFSRPSARIVLWAICGVTHPSSPDVLRGWRRVLKGIAESCFYRRGVFQVFYSAVIGPDIHTVNTRSKRVATGFYQPPSDRENIKTPNTSGLIVTSQLIINTSLMISSRLGWSIHVSRKEQHAVFNGTNITSMISNRAFNCPSCVHVLERSA